MEEGARIRLGSAQGRWILFATILASGVVFLDGTVVNVALPAIRRKFSSDLGTLQWVLDAYLLLLGSLVLLGGDLGDLLGRRRVFLWGLTGFAVSSALCGVAPDALVLIGARAVQGAFAALLVPSSLAILSSSFSAAERGRAIGAWSGFSGVSTAVGPVLGGVLVDRASWRWVFLINAPIVAATIALTLRHMPADTMPEERRRIDIPGAAACVAGLGLLIAACIEQERLGAAGTAAVAAAGVALLALFVGLERRGAAPMLPLGIFGSRDFTVTNVVTLAVYGALGGALFLVVVELQQALGYSALQSGASLLPITFLLLVMSPRVGALSARIGARPLMTAGPLLAALGLALMVRISPGSGYLGGILPEVLVFGAGLGLTVAPLTTTALSSVTEGRAGIASGVNNAAARVAGLVAVALLPALAGLAGGVVTQPAAFTAGFHRAMVIAAAVCAVGGLVAAAGLTSRAGRPAA